MKYRCPSESKCKGFVRHPESPNIRVKFLVVEELPRSPWSFSDQQRNAAARYFVLWTRSSTRSESSPNPFFKSLDGNEKCRKLWPEVSAWQVKEKEKHLRLYVRGGGGVGLEFSIMTTESGEFCDMQLSVKLRQLKQVFHFFLLSHRSHENPANIS